MEEDLHDELMSQISELKERMKQLEREFRLKDDPDVTDQGSDLLGIKGDFFQMINALKALYPDQEEDQLEILRISKDIENGNLKVDMTDLFFRFFVRQEINLARMKLLFLSQRLDVDPALFDQLDDLSVLIDDPRYSVHQVIIGWRRFERDVSNEIARLKEDH